ncbi:HIT-like domain-containing protein [Fimicolochytrium jonesii]|uniref:HIT-like domain-containing protein n=1 Tax=Fimicolochytrium jonesii TaxID=1396493 RepID=UPI0022FE2A5D|nr:HIT-like domain-containing protein [Fimicolochytrium jonesii]KAI8820716.1 HIT-like domain-containing protein [Fimicolochytrium jonesii]
MPLPRTLLHLFIILTPLLLLLLTPSLSISTEHSDIHILHDLWCTQVEMPAWLSSLTGCFGVVGAEESQKLGDGEGGTGRQCVFCGIANGTDERARVVFQNEEFVAFHDINPSASTHLLLIPRAHIPTVKDLPASSHPLISRMSQIGHTLLSDMGYPPSRHRLGFHVPPFTSVPHLHMHVLGLPYRGRLRSIKYPERWRWSRWFVEAERYGRSLKEADERGWEGNWTWRWVRD